MVRLERGMRYLMALQKREDVSTVWLMEKFGISLAQAKRDMREIERFLPVRRVKKENRIVLELM